MSTASGGSSSIVDREFKIVLPAHSTLLTYDAANKICSSAEINTSYTSAVPSGYRQEKIRDFVSSNAINLTNFWISLANDSTSTAEGKETCVFLSRNDDFHKQRQQNCTSALGDESAVLCERKPAGQYTHRDSDTTSVSFWTLEPGCVIEEQIVFLQAFVTHDQNLMLFILDLIWGCPNHFGITLSTFFSSSFFHFGFWHLQVTRQKRHFR